MQNKNFKRIAAVALAATMTIGGSLTAFAADTDPANGANGTGTSIPHVNREIISVTLPTAAEVNNVFNYTVDTEGLIKEAGKLLNGTEVTGNDDGVYFQTADGYASTSKTVTFTGKNSVAVDVSVKAVLTASAGGKDIAVVADEAALNAATGPAILLKLVVGGNEAAIVSGDTGVTVKSAIAGKPDNFELKPNAGGTAFEFVEKSGASGWGTTTVQLKGKTNGKDATDGMTAPQIALTWTTAKATAAAPSISTTSYTLTAGDAVTVNVDLGTGNLAAEGIAEITFVDSGTTKTLAETNYTFADGVLTFATTYTDKLAAKENFSRVFAIKFDDEAGTSIDVTLSTN